MAPKTLLTVLLASCAALSQAQSSNPGIGTNSDAQGATEDVTPGSGPNGYALSRASFPHKIHSALTIPKFRRLV